MLKVPYGDRSHEVIEPFLTDNGMWTRRRWRSPPLGRSREGKTQFIPENWRNVYFQWLENIQPWCISRQLWWGHQIPAWYGPDGHIFVAHDENEAALAKQHYRSKGYADLREVEIDKLSGGNLALIQSAIVS